MRRMLVLLFILALFAGIAQAEEILTRGSAKIHYFAQEKSLAELTAKNLAPALKKVEQKLGLPMDFPMAIHLLPEARYRRWVGRQTGEWSAAVAMPTEGRILINTTKVDLLNNVYHTLLHELVHLALGRVEVKSRKSIPLWFHEGVAQWVVQSFFKGSTNDLALAAGGGGLHTLGDLTESFPPGGSPVKVAYAQSYDAILYLERLHDSGIVLRILALMTDGASFPEAFARETKTTLPVFERNWQKQITGGRPFFLVYLADNPELLLVLIMILGAAALTAGYVRYRLRRRRILARWDEEEGL